MSTQKIIIGTISGVLAGVAVGLLVAPMTGEETRQKIVDKADELGSGVKDTFTKLTKKAAMKVDDLKSALGEEIEGLSDDVRQRIVKLLDSNKPQQGDNAKQPADNGGNAQASKQPNATQPS